MHPKRKKRLMMIIIILTGSSLAIAMALYALSKNINLYYTPSQVLKHPLSAQVTFRMGGLVAPGSIHFSKQGLTVFFLLTDKVKAIPVRYHGTLPDLFRAGQGVVAEGRLNATGTFIADQILAKHSADYMPPVVRDALLQAQKNRQAKQ